MRVISIRRIALMAALAILAVPNAASPAHAEGGCAVGYSDAGFGYCQAALVATGGLQTLPVPAGVTRMQITVTGGKGGMSLDQGTGSGSPGGLGGREIANVPVTPGAVLSIVVGQTGGVADLITPPPAPYGGGGAPGGPYGGFGGGGTFVFSSATGLLIAAGGGGGGGYDYNPDARGQAVPQQAQGGAGSGASAANDGHSVAFCCDTTTPPPPHVAPGGGKGATPAGPGTGGIPDPSGIPGFGPSDGNPGQGPATGVASLGVGGAGPPGSGASGCFDSWAAGGGGGYYGGGSGGNIACDLEGGGGGGGAGYVVAGSTGTLSTTGFQAGDGTASIVYIRKAPSAPSGVKAVPGMATSKTGPLTVSFTAGAANGSPITKFVATCSSTNGGAAHSVAGTKSPIVVTSLTTAKTYRCVVKATNAIGSSPASTAAPAAVVGAPMPPVNVHAVRVTKGQVTVSWVASSGNGSPNTNFNVACVSSNGGASSGSGAPKSPVRIILLTPNKKYTCTVKGINKRGTGLPSAPSPQVIP